MGKKNPLNEMFKLKFVKDDFRLNTVVVPALRTFGFSLLVIYVLLYDQYILDTVSTRTFALFFSVLSAYVLVSWLALKYSYGKTGRLDLALVFLVLDLFLALWVMYFTGAEKSV